MRKNHWIKEFKPVDADILLDCTLETAGWIEQYGHVLGEKEWWDTFPGEKVSNNALLLKDTCLYGGAAGIALLYLRIYVVTDDKAWLEKAKAGINYCISEYKGIEDFHTEENYLQGAYVGLFHGPAGGAYVANQIYKITKEDKYKEYAIIVGDDAIRSAHVDDDTLYWYGFYGILGEDAYEAGRDIAQTDGVFLGQSAAAAIYAATQIAKRPENVGKNVVTILADNGMKYLSTNMYPLDHKVQ